MYRLTPPTSKVMVPVLALSAIILVIIPVAAQVFASSSTPQSKTVTLGSMDSDDDIPVMARGKPLTCLPDDMSMFMNGYDCGEALIDSTIVEKVDDEELAFRRMVRAGSPIAVDPETPIHEFGPIDVIDDPETNLTALWVPRDDGEHLYVQVTGSSTAEYVGEVWDAVSDEELPVELSDAVQGVKPLPDVERV